VIEHEVLDAVRARYRDWPDKGRSRDGRRLTLLPETTTCAPGEEIRLWHVLEATGPVELFVMGPKPVHGEYVDGRPATPPPPAGEDPFVPGAYDGRTLTGPGLDVNWEPTAHRFAQPGSHTVQWRLGGLESNEVHVTVG
jgi:hypothetical protein